MKDLGRKAGALLAALAIGGCTVVSPIVDRGMGDAPNAACAAVNGAHPLMMRPRPGAAPETAEAGAPAQCFVLAEELTDGSRRAWSGGPLQPGRVLVAVFQPGADADCAGTFTHLTVSGASDGAGQAELATWDLHGRPGHSRTVRWDRAFSGRSFALASVGSTMMNPAGARVRVLQGSFDPANLCFKSY